MTTSPSEPEQTSLPDPVTGNGGVGYTGLKLCDPCWNGQHFHRSKELNQVITDCLGGRCECPCKQLNEELTLKRKRIRPDHSKQANLFLDLLVETITHRDDN